MQELLMVAHTLPAAHWHPYLQPSAASHRLNRSCCGSWNEMSTSFSSRSYLTTPQDPVQIHLSNSTNSTAFAKSYTAMSAPASRNKPNPQATETTHISLSHKDLKLLTAVSSDYPICSGWHRQREHQQSTRNLESHKRIHVTLGRNSDQFLLNEPQIPESKFAAILTLRSWKCHRMTCLSTLPFALPELFSGILNMAF